MPDNENRALDGKVAVVTGASRNNGRAIALSHAGEGAAIVVNAVTNAADAKAVAGEITGAGGRAIHHLADVRDESAVNAMMDAAVAAFGRIDILVNNAAVRRHHPISELSFAEWREITGIILDGAFLCTKACLPHMRAAGGGAIVNIGGVSAHIGAPDRANVIDAKAGLVGLTKALAVELAGEGITANCVVPGTIDTVRGGSAGPQANFSHASLVERLGKPEEIAAMVRHLCLPEGGYITGQTIHVSGGRYLG